MPINRGTKPKKPSTGRRRSSAGIPRTVMDVGMSRGAGSRYAETYTREPDLGGGLPRAAPPVIATSPAEIRSRAFGKREANRRRGAANNVLGYVAPAPTIGNQGRLPTAQELLESTEPSSGGVPTAEALLRLTSEQAYPSDAVGEGTYLFPQVSPTKTINPQRPRTLESGWERIKDPSHPAYPGILRVRFRNGDAYEYYNVPASVWQRYKRVQSPGRFVTRVLDQYPYARGDF